MLISWFTIDSQQALIVTAHCGSKIHQRSSSSQKREHSVLRFDWAHWGIIEYSPKVPSFIPFPSSMDSNHWIHWSMNASVCESRISLLRKLHIPSSKLLHRHGSSVCQPQLRIACKNFGRWFDDGSPINFTNIVNTYLYAAFAFSEVEAVTYN